MAEKRNPDEPTIERLEEMVSERQPQIVAESADAPVTRNRLLNPEQVVIDPTPKIIYDSRPPHTRHKGRFVVLAVVAVAVLSGLFIKFVFMTPETKKPATAASNSQEVVPLIGAAVDNNLRIYRQTVVENGTPASQSTYSLLDDADNKVVEASGDSQLELLATMSSGKFLFKSGSGEKAKHYTFSAEGIKELDLQLTGLSQVSGRAVGLTGFSDTKVAYQYCQSGASLKAAPTAYNCDLRTFDVVSGAEEVAPLSSDLKSYKPRLLAFSTDRKSAYFIGMSSDDRTALKDKILALTKDKSLEGADTRTRFANLTYGQRIIKLDLASQKITSAKPVETYYSFYNKYWVSPNGRHLVYSVKGEDGSLHYVDVDNGAAAKITLPATDDSSQPWSGNTATYDPVFSPDSQYMAYVSYGSQFTNQLESIGLLDFKSKISRELARQPNDGSGTASYFSNLRWYGNDQLEFRAGRENQRFNISTSAIQTLTGAPGLLVSTTDNTD